MTRKLTKTSTSFAFTIAAFALTISTAQAFGSQSFLTQASLSDEQVIAVQEARELKQLGDLAAARDVLLAAGFDSDIIADLRQAHQAYKTQSRHWLKTEIDTKLSPDQKEALLVAKAANDKALVDAILAEAGVERPHFKVRY